MVDPVLIEFMHIVQVVYYMRKIIIFFPYKAPEVVDNSVAVIRTDLVVFALNMTLLYTGAGNITQFKIEYRRTGSNWRQVESPAPLAVPAFTSGFSWNHVAVTVAEEFASMGPLEFRITVTNEAGLVRSSEVTETVGKCACLHGCHRYVCM